MIICLEYLLSKFAFILREHGDWHDAENTTEQASLTHAGPKLATALNSSKASLKGKAKITQTSYIALITPYIPSLKILNSSSSSTSEGLSLYGMAYPRAPIKMAFS